MRCAVRSVASVCLSVCLSVCNALTFESLDLESLFVVYTCIFRICRLGSYIKVIGSRSRSQEQKCFRRWCAFDWKAILFYYSCNCKMLTSYRQQLHMSTRHINNSKNRFYEETGGVGAPPPLLRPRRLVMTSRAAYMQAVASWRHVVTHQHHVTSHVINTK